MWYKIIKKQLNLILFFLFNTPQIAALLHRAADMDHKPTIKETRFLLPKPALSARDIKPPQWVNMVQGSWDEGVHRLSTTQAKAKVLETLSVWPLFGSSFFAVSILFSSLIASKFADDNG